MLFTLPTRTRGRTATPLTVAALTLLLALAASPLVPVAVLAQETAAMEVVENPARHPDPMEKFNRAIYRFNDRVDRAVLRPIATRYVRYVPSGVRRGIGNFVNNLREPTTIVNDLLQGKIGQAGQDTLRFLVNTTFGVLGIFDVATQLEMPRNREDFGQTLGRWGVPSGPYLVLPFLGPSNIRDAAGLVPQYVYTDLTAGIDDDAVLWTIFAARAVDTRAELLKVDRLLGQQLDPYVFVRESYHQRRIADIHDGEPPGQEDNDALLDELLQEN